MRARARNRTAGARADAPARITARIVELIESGRELPWRSWTAGGGAAPLRATGEPYRGINHLHLRMEGAARGYSSPFWMTFAQSKALGGSVRKGERSVPVVYYGTVARGDGAPAPGSWPERAGEGGGPPDAPPDDPLDEPMNESGGYRFLRTYRAFNACQIGGLPERFHPPAPEREARPVEALEAFFARLPVRISVGGSQAAYIEARDEIVIPPMERFREAGQYYATLLHEAAHASGTAPRLARACHARYHVDLAARAEEELVAELTAALAGPRLGLGVDHIEDHAAYVKSWLAALRNDSRWIFRCAGAAQRAEEWIFAAAGEGEEARGPARARA